MRYHVTVNGAETEIEVTAGGVRVDGAETAAELHRIEGTDRWALRLGDRSYEVAAHPLGDGGWSLAVDGREAEVEAVDERTRRIRSMHAQLAGPAGPKPVKAPMPGLVVRIEVEVGDEVRAGQGVAIVEAMKMENELAAEADGRVTKIRVAAGDTVGKDQILIDLEPLEAPEA